LFDWKVALETTMQIQAEEKISMLKNDALHADSIYKKNTREKKSVKSA
jgi:hypothetical protein